MTEANKNKGNGVQSLIRGLNVLRALNECMPATVTQIVKSTALPKATVIRLLRTLNNEGYIGFDQVNGGYKPLPKVRLLSGSLLVSNTFALSVRKILNDFAQVIKWPADVLMPEGAAMVVQASNRDTSPISIKRFEQVRFSLLASASGQAFLAATSADQRGRLVEIAANLESDNSDIESIRSQVLQNTERFNERGYAVADYNAPIDGTRAVAIPLVSGGEPFGSVAMLLIRDAVSEDQLHGFLLPQLNQVARAIVGVYAEVGHEMMLAPFTD